MPITDRDESALVGHGPCDECGSRDNVAIRASGRTFCHGCGHSTFPEDMKAKRQKERPMSDYKPVPGEIRGLTKEYGLAESTNQKLGIRIVKYRAKYLGELLPSQGCISFDYRRIDGSLYGQKIRYAQPEPGKDKTFAFPNAGGTPPLYAAHLWNAPRLKSLMCLEGEGDTAAYLQVTKFEYPAVGVPTGANGFETIFKDPENLAFLKKADEVVLCFDGDEAGRKRVNEAAELLTSLGIVVKIGEVQGHKDARAALMAGDVKAITGAFFNASPFRPDGLVPIEDLFDEAEKPAVWGLAWPWPKMTKVTLGIRRSEMYLFGGGVGCGKTEIFKELIFNVTENWGLRAGVIFLEEKPAKTAKVLAGKLANKRFHLPTTVVEPGEIRQHLEKLRGKVELYNHFGSKDWESLRAKIRYMVVVLGIKDIFLDHLTALSAGQKDASGVDAFLNTLCAELAGLVEGLDFTLYVIPHLTTPKTGKPHEEGGRVLENQFTGSRGIMRWAHNMIGIERNKQDPTSPTVIRILKERESGDANGQTIGLRWLKDIGRYEECDMPSEGSKGDYAGFKSLKGPELPEEPEEDLEPLVEPLVPSNLAWADEGPQVIPGGPSFDPDDVPF